MISSTHRCFVPTWLLRNPDDLRFGRWDSDFAQDAVAKLDEVLVQISEVGDAIEQAYWASDEVVTADVLDEAAVSAASSRQSQSNA